ncbi:hypothetical protein OHT57_00565 [Streptomyces sp. NBC_00285]|uniref:hypothetical protein n=1 Tax=Streptomyces sp. NBC_00285 TaxID=2975700 RepID=UPI002E2DB596|nr:hypothetical protein [Streptomyces sp. NBC_00285]
MKRILTITAVAGLALFGMGSISASAATLGGVDMQRACNTQYPPSFGLKAVVLDQHNAYSWRCAAPWDNTRQINVNAACANQYGPGAYAGLGSATNPYSWYCRR